MRHLHPTPHNNYDALMAECGGRPKGSELPQVLSEEDVILDTLCEITGQPRGFADAMYHHQLSSDRFYRH